MYIEISREELQIIKYALENAIENKDSFVHEEYENPRIPSPHLRPAVADRALEALKAAG